jgi:hypothetical protein
MFSYPIFYSILDSIIITANKLKGVRSSPRFQLRYINDLPNTLNSNHIHYSKNIEFTLTPLIWWSNKKGAPRIHFFTLVIELV